MFPTKGPQNWAALARHTGETLDKGCWEEPLCELLYVNNGDKPSSENYTLTPGKLPHRKPQNKPLPLGLLPRSSMELNASQLGHKAKSISTFPSQENHFPVVPFISASLQHSPPSSCKQTTLTLAPRDLTVPRLSSEESRVWDKRIEARWEKREREKKKD